MSAGLIRRCGRPAAGSRLTRRFRHPPAATFHRCRSPVRLLGVELCMHAPGGTFFRLPAAAGTPCVTQWHTGDAAIATSYWSRYSCCLVRCTAAIRSRPRTAGANVVRTAAAPPHHVERCHAPHTCNRSVPLPAAAAVRHSFQRAAADFNVGGKGWDRGRFFPSVWRTPRTGAVHGAAIMARMAQRGRGGSVQMWVGGMQPAVYWARTVPAY